MHRLHPPALETSCQIPHPSCDCISKQGLQRQKARLLPVQFLLLMTWYCEQGPFSGGTDRVGSQPKTGQPFCWAPVMPSAGRAEAEQRLTGEWRQDAPVFCSALPGFCLRGSAPRTLFLITFLSHGP